MLPEVTDEVLVEAQAPRGDATLGVENARNARIGIVLCQPAYQGNGVFVGANSGGS